MYGMRLTFDDNAFDDLAWWITHDTKIAKRIVGLIQECTRTPFSGRGKPEPLKYELAGCWSRRIDDTHRLVYIVTDNEIRILSCRFHYTK